MMTLKIDESFTGFTAEQSSQVAISAHHFSRRNHKSGERMPTCTIGEEMFQIVGVRSRGLGHSVKRRDGKWIELDRPALIQWHLKGTPPGMPINAPPPGPPATDAEVRQRVTTAVGNLVRARALIDETAATFWGIDPLLSERDRLLKIHQTLTVALTELRMREDALRPRHTEETP